MPSNGSATGGAARAWRHNGLVAWNAAYADIQEASECKSENEQRAFVDQVQSVLSGSSLGLMEAQQISIQQRLACRMGRYFTHPIHQPAIDQADLGRASLPTVFLLFADRNPIAWYAIARVRVLPFEQGLLKLIGQCLIGAETKDPVVGCVDDVGPEGYAGNGALQGPPRTGRLPWQYRPESSRQSPPLRRTDGASPECVRGEARHYEYVAMQRFLACANSSENIAVRENGV